MICISLHKNNSLLQRYIVPIIIPVKIIAASKTVMKPEYNQVKNVNYLEGCAFSVVSDEYKFSVKTTTRCFKNYQA